jgi:hypothetical protein
MPNHMFLQSGTSCGATNNEIYTHVGGQTVSYPQDTIFDRMREHLGNGSFGLFSACDRLPVHAVWFKQDIERDGVG